MCIRDRAETDCARIIKVGYSEYRKGSLINEKLKIVCITLFKITHDFKVKEELSISISVYHIVKHTLLQQL